jgi:hypothetical protein
MSALPLILAAFGLVLVAFAIFAPQRVAVPAVSLAPPLAPPAPTWAFSPGEPFVPEPLDEITSAPLTAAEQPRSPRWPALIDPRAIACTPSDRIALVDALAAVATPWARDVLLQALPDEDDPQVRTALAEALSKQDVTSPTL